MEGVTQQVRRALVVEDDRDIRELVDAQLLRSGLDVRAADTGPARVEAVAPSSPT